MQNKLITLISCQDKIVSELKSIKLDQAIQKLVDRPPLKRSRATEGEDDDLEPPKKQQKQ